MIMRLSFFKEIRYLKRLQIEKTFLVQFWVFSGENFPLKSFQTLKSKVWIESLNLTHQNQTQFSPLCKVIMEGDWLISVF